MEDNKLTRVFSRTPSSWDPQDDLLLRHLKEQQKLGWKEIASHFAHRTPNACQFRWRRLRSGSLKGASSASSANTTPTAPTAKDVSTSPSTSPPSQSPSLKSLTVKTASMSTKSLMSKFQSTTATPLPTPPVNIPEASYTFKQKKIIGTNEDDTADPLSSSLNSVSSDEWTQEEDGLLLARRKRALSFAELSILLPQRTEAEIQKRISALEPPLPLPPVQPVVKDLTKQTYLTATPRRKRHSHSTHYTPTHYIATHTGGVLRERSFSTSSQNSTGGFLSGDALRSKSFSYTVPPLFNNMTPVGERYTLRKGSISYVRRNSVLRESAVSDDEDEKPKLTTMPHGVVFNDFYTK